MSHPTDVPAIRPVAASAAFLVLLAGCAGSTPPPGDLIPEVGTWSFHGTVEGVNQYRNGPRRFIEAVSGTVEFLPDEILVTSTHGSCRKPRPETMSSLLAVSCDRMQLSVSRTRGSVTIPLQQENEVRGSCVSYDANRRCVEWSWQVRVVDTRRSGPVVVTAHDHVADRPDASGSR